jgi:hypothetical protein
LKIDGIVDNFPIPVGFAINVGNSCHLIADGLKVVGGYFLGSFLVNGLGKAI